jgi:hypothetical protein
MDRTRVISYVNRKDWWHVPPADPLAYVMRGKFFASSFKEAEFYGRPLDEPQHVSIQNPLIGDEETIERELFGKRISNPDISVEARWKLDAELKKAALIKGYDSIVLMTKKGVDRYRTSGKIPRSLELNVFLERVSR